MIDRFSADGSVLFSFAIVAALARLGSSQLRLALCSSLQALSSRVTYAYVACPFSFLLQANLTVQSLVMQSSSLNANQALNRMYRANTY